jgi:hypothetical protein
MKTIAAIVVLSFAPAAHALFKCVDEHGRTLIGETPPAECEKVPMVEVSKMGHILRRIDPTPTPEQVKAREEEARLKRAAEKAAAEQARKDKALLASFASEKEFDVTRERNIDPLTGRITASRERIKEIDKRMAEIQKQKESFAEAAARDGKEHSVPPFLLAEEERHAREKQTLAASIGANEKEIVAIRERFERDKKRWIDLRSGAVPSPTPVKIKGSDPN